MGSINNEVSGIIQCTVDLEDLYNKFLYSDNRVGNRFHQIIESQEFKDNFSKFVCEWANEKINSVPYRELRESLFNDMNKRSLLINLKINIAVNVFKMGINRFLNEDRDLNDIMIELLTMKTVNRVMGAYIVYLNNTTDQLVENYISQLNEDKQSFKSEKCKFEKTKPQDAMNKRGTIYEMPDFLTENSKIN